MTLSNLGFETVGTNPGDALGWSVTETITRERRALWGSAVLVDEEDFETEWSSNESYFFVFIGLLTDLEPAIFDTSLGSPNGVEDFEDGWSSNEGYSFELGSNAIAVFDGPKNFEDFETEWSNNQSYLFVLSGGMSALFDVALEAFENFEEEWRSNESYDFTMGSVDAALFVVNFVFGSPVTAAHENFESAYAEHLVSFTPGTDRVNLTSHGFTTDDVLTFRVVGPGALPGGLNLGTQYFVISVLANTFQVSLTFGGTAVDVTDSGSGTIYVARDTAVYWAQRIDQPIV